MQYWKKYSSKTLTEKINIALQKNIDYNQGLTLGYPVSYLDGIVFNDDAPFLKDTPLLKAYISNPNHIGCHTLGESEVGFQGSHELEIEVLNVIAVDIFNAKPNDFDGYIATGGTEANIQALWVYRNYFTNDFNASFDQIAIISSEDTHYSIPKGANLLGLKNIIVPVDFETRIINREILKKHIIVAQENGTKYFIVISNMATTMFGSVDDPNLFVSVLTELNAEFKMHIDGAFGGFVYPFNKEKLAIDFTNPHIDSIAIDAHKMLQAPYGTGIFICRKELIHNVLTQEAAYVNGMDLTLCGSRSGSNALAVWMILFTYGYHKWYEKISVLLMRTDWLCEQLDSIGIEYYRHPNMNIVALKSNKITPETAKKFYLVPETHKKNNKWYKVVIMNHVEINHLERLLESIKQALLE